MGASACRAGPTIPACPPLMSCMLFIFPNLLHEHFMTQALGGKEGEFYFLF
jgi:hypothetical protein